MLKHCHPIRTETRMKSHYVYRKQYRGPIKAVILDWSGTTTDRYVIAPAVAFRDVFNKYGVKISMEEARRPMGLRKDLHIKSILEIPDVGKRWKEVYGKEWRPQDVELMFRDFVPMQLECLPKYSELMPETVGAVNTLRSEYKVKIGSTTGFNREMVDLLLKESRKQGYVPDVTVAGDEVLNGARPKPHMVYKNMDLLDVNPIQAIVKVDDTVSGCNEATEAGCWSVGIARWSNYMNINSYDEELVMSKAEIDYRLQYSRELLEKSGAHYVINRLDELPLVVEDINQKLKRGEMP